jgi:2-haloacid dehalogenase
MQRHDGMAHRRRRRGGLGAALIRRVGNDVLGIGPQPQIVGDDLNDVANQLIARHQGRT